MLIKALLVWLFMLFLAIANGTARVMIIVPRLGDYSGHTISGCHRLRAFLISHMDVTALDCPKK